MTIGYVVRRIGIFFLIVITAVTLNFFIPRLSSTNPIQSRMNQLAAQGGVYENQIQELIKIYNKKFGFDQPLWRQYSPAITARIQDRLIAGEMSAAKARNIAPSVNARWPRPQHAFET